MEWSDIRVQVKNLKKGEDREKIKNSLKDFFIQFCPNVTVTLRKENKKNSTVAVFYAHLGTSEVATAVLQNETPTIAGHDVSYQNVLTYLL